MKIKHFTKIFIVIYVAFLVVFLINKPNSIIGEWDDYSLPIASIVNDFNFSITQDDVEVYKEIFPQWSEYIDNYKLSGYKTADGGELTWYFPVYAIACMPAVFLLKLFNLPGIYAFTVTNVILLLLSLFIVYRFLKVNDGLKLVLIAALSINPVIAYLSWTSAEVLIYSCLVAAMVFWYNNWYKRAGFAVSVAAMLNPCIYALGFFMIIEYVIHLYREYYKKESAVFVLKKLVCYGACYIIGLVPMIYNYVHTGFINLTASYSGFISNNETVIQRFLAYLFDLNFGFLVFFPVLLVVGIVFIVLSARKKQFRYVGIISGFLLIVLLYSIMIHINCGMSGIARYNSWSAVILIFAVILFADKLIKSKRIIAILLSASIVFTAASMFVYVKSDGYMHPVAKWFLDNAPGLYNPLHSTFNARVHGIDGGYDVKTPVIYSDDDGYVRKILAKSKDRGKLLSGFSSLDTSEKWMKDKIYELTDEQSYISVPKKHKILQCYSYNLGESILFFSENANYGDYVVSNLWQQEEWGTWIKGKTFRMRFKTNSDAPYFDAGVACSVFNDYQRIKISVNGENVYDDVATNVIKFNCPNPGSGKVIEVEFFLPDAVSPLSLGMSMDERELSIGLQQIVFVEK